MKKYLLISLALILVIGGIVYATVSPSRFPTGPGSAFPSMPTAPGTIGYILSLFSPDGTARNTERLGGIPASGYLKNKSCNPLEVWVGIDADGYPICGTRIPLLVGNFTEVSAWVKLIKPDNTVITPVIGVTNIEEWDLIMTNGGTGTIQFAQDASYIRLDANTTVEIRTGTLGGNTVAEAILADGQLWGRIMTSTGVNLGGGGLVAGVRGTSVAIGYDKNTQKINISVIDSTKNDAATITNTKTNQSIIVDAGSTVIEQSGSTVPPTEETSITKVSLLTGNAWARKNTLEDIKYLAQKLESATTPENSKQRVEEEITSATPSATDELRALLSTTTPIVGTTDSAANEIITEENEDKNDVNGEYSKKTDSQKSIIKTKRIACKQEGKSYWVTTDKCEEKGWRAYADYTNGDTKLYFKNYYIVLSNNTYDISGKNLGTYTLSIEWATTNPVTNLEVYADMRDYNDEELLLELTATKTSSIINWTILKKASSFSKLIIKK
jgi:hypothetical protein